MRRVEVHFGIAIEELESELEGDIDLNGFLGLDANVPKGFTEIRASFRVKADQADVDSIRALAEFSPLHKRPKYLAGNLATLSTAASGNDISRSACQHQ